MIGVEPIESNFLNIIEIITNGKTAKGTTRYRCKECNKTWSDRSIGKPPQGLTAMTNAEKPKKFRDKNKTY